MSDPHPTVHFVMTEENLTQAILRGTADAQRSVRWRYAAYAVALTVAWFFMHPLSQGLTPFLLLYGAFVFAVLAVARPWLVRRHVSQLVAERSDLDMPIELRVTEDEFHIDVPGVKRSNQVLATIHAAVAQPDGTLIQPFPNEFLWVPATVFSSADARQLFDRALFAGLRIPDPAL